MFYHRDGFLASFISNFAVSGKIAITIQVLPHTRREDRIKIFFPAFQLSSTFRVRKNNYSHLNGTFLSSRVLEPGKMLSATRVILLLLRTDFLLCDLCSLNMLHLAALVALLGRDEAWKCKKRQ